MERLAIPGSALSISRLGFGCARLFAGAELGSSARLIEAALRAGITHFDTAPAYGSEDVLGEVLAGEAGITIATKVGLARRTDAAPSPRRFFGAVYRRSLRPLLARNPALKSALLHLAASTAKPAGARTLRPLHRQEVLRELEESLRRLKRTAVDLYLLHEPEGLVIADELRELFDSLQAQGVIHAYGLAFGGVRDSGRRFGTAVQCRYQRETAQDPHAGFARLYHGVLRYQPQQAMPARSSWPARELVRQALASDPACAVVFSASSRQQIEAIAASHP
jgi:aryl-alcohol dehydrogenase-like predicted oxidoreductase